MNRFAFPCLFAVAAALFAGGCGKKEETPVSAREKRAIPQPSAKSDVSRWKETGSRDGAYGIVVEQDGAKVSANLYTLLPGDGLVIRERESLGKYFPDQKALIFPLYSPSNITAEVWVKDGGPHIVVPWTSSETKLVGTLVQPGKSNTYSFSKLEGVVPAYPTGANTK